MDHDGDRHQDHSPSNGLEDGGFDSFLRQSVHVVLK